MRQCETILAPAQDWQTELEAWRTDGWYPVRSAPVSVQPRLGEETVVELSLPTAKQAGMVARASPTEEGRPLTAIRAGSAADLAGLLPGDVVLSVDGLEVAGLEVVRFLGKGGMGIVVEARHRKLDQRFAIKVLLPEALERPDAVARFEREARAAARLKTPHVVRVVDVDTDPEPQERG